jgi:lambda family phage portal protein
VRRLTTNTVGIGIRPKATGLGADRVMELWKLWAETTQCDAAGRQTFYGLQVLIMRTVATSGECLVLRRRRFAADGLAVPLQLQVLEPDYLDTGKDALVGEAGGPIIQGIEFDAIGRRAAYWLFSEHPGGGVTSMSPMSRRVEADRVLHIYEQERPGEVRGMSWFASVDMRLHEFHIFEDATLKKQCAAASLAAFVVDRDTQGDPVPPPQGGVDATTGHPTGTLEPGMFMSLPPGRDIKFTQPPACNDHASYSAVTLRGVAAGLGVTYEDLTGDFSQTNYSSGRMGRLGAKADAEDWQWNMLIPQFCQPAWIWMLEAMQLAGERVDLSPAVWHPSAMPILEPAMEIPAYADAVRNGFMTWPQVIQELGNDPREQLAEIEANNKALDKSGIVLDCDPRKVSSSGQQQSGGPSAASAATAPAKPKATPPDQTGSDGADTPPAAA